MEPRFRRLRADEGWFPPDSELPAVIEPADDTSVDGICGSVRAHHELVEAKLLRHGALLFRGFDIRSVTDFERLALAVDPGLRDRLPLDDGIRRFYTSHVYAGADYVKRLAPFLHLPFHYEDNYLPIPPSKIMFFCRRASTGGETVIVDGRRVYAAIPPATRAKLEHRSYESGRFIEEAVLFENAGTADRASIETLVRAHGVSNFEWRNGADNLAGLSIASELPTVIRHHATGEPVWYNALFQLDPIGAVLDRFLALRRIGDWRLRATATVGAAAMALLTASHVRGWRGRRFLTPRMAFDIARAHWAHAVAFRWRSGDVLVIDNQLVAHGRLPLLGNRELFASTARPCIGSAAA